MVNQFFYFGMSCLDWIMQVGVSRRNIDRDSINHTLGWKKLKCAKRYILYLHEGNDGFPSIEGAVRFIKVLKASKLWIVG